MVRPEHDITHPSASLRRVLLPLALTQFVASFAGSSVLAMVALAATGLTGLGAAMFLPTDPVPQRE